MWHLITLAGVMGLGLALRVWQLDLKPLWLDEVITAIFALGRSFADVPVQRFVSVDAIAQFFTVQPGVTCPQIAERVATESVHPPLFFCLLYGWLRWLRPEPDQLIWALRTLPALLGVGAIAAIYGLNRLAFSASAGLMAAALMAVSPFAVYLSQEARHYTLPMLLITLALMGLVLMQQDVQRRRGRWWAWLGWIGINGLGLYVHYFFVLAWIAQIIALTGWMLWRRRQIAIAGWAAVAGAIAAVVLIDLPWLPTVIAHSNRPETDWIQLSPGLLSRINPLLQTLAGWIITVIMLPVEDQPAFITIPCGAVMLLFAGGLTWQLIRRVRPLVRHAVEYPGFVLLAGFTGSVILEFLAIVYLLGKDLTIAPRYNFVYYPGLCALLGMALVSQPDPAPAAVSDRGSPAKSRWIQWAVVLVGLMSSAVVVHNLAFLKSFNPDTVARRMYGDGARPVLMVVAYPSNQEIALGLSFALELQRRQQRSDPGAAVQVAFLERTADYPSVWTALANLPQAQPLPLRLWVVGSPDLSRDRLPPMLTLQTELALNPQATCAIVPDRYHRALNVPYQGYECFLEPTR